MSECLICRAPAKLSLIHREIRRKRDLWWADACGDAHMRKIRAVVFELPGWYWRVDRVGKGVTAVNPERAVEAKAKVKAKRKA